jgi:phospholipase A-2-activating protein
VRKPSAQPTDNAERLLLGHAHNVAALDVAPSGRFVISGGWDGQARVWSTAKWETEVMLAGHEGHTVWAVLAYSDNVVVTGCADKNIRVFDLRKSSEGEAQAVRTIVTPDVVRALVRLPRDHPSGADVASASNDGVIRLWKVTGQQVGELHGHDSYIYSLAVLPSGEIVSSGEDRTVRIWKDNQCIQTITHPAISVWTVASNAEGDIASGSSDGAVRVFSRTKVADAELLAQFEEAVRASAIPKQQMDIDPERLPGPDFLTQKSGTKEGQVQLIKDPSSGSVTAHQWSMSQQTWVNVGTVVDAVGSSGKKVEYQGQQYDFVFDVDIEEGKPPLKLPYNLSENPYERAMKWLGDNELPMTYLDEVTNFIVKNTKGATIGANESHGGPDPFGSEGRYRPGDAAGSTGEPPRKKIKYLPHEEYLSLTQAKFERTWELVPCWLHTQADVCIAAQKKILSINADLKTSSQKDHALNPTDEGTLESLITSLTASKDLAKLSVSDRELSLVIKLATRWTYKDRLPGLDLLRVMAASPSVAGYKAGGGSLVDLALRAAFEPESPPVNENAAMMALRLVANLFLTKPGRAVAAASAEKVLHAMETVAGEHGPAVGVHNRNVGIALTTAAFNYMVLLYRSTHNKAAGASAPETEILTLMANVLQTVLREQTDSEVSYRALMALGMTVSAGGEVGEAVKLLGVDESVKAAVKGASEQRVKDVGGEVLVLLK